MPQKKNPDLPELFRAKSGRATGNLVNLLTIVKGLPLAYNKDLQEDKLPLFDSAEQSLASLKMAIRLVSKLKFDKKRLKDLITKGEMTAVDMADYLVLKGMPFRQAHHVVGSAIGECEKMGVSTIAKLSLKELKAFSKLFEKDVYDYLDPVKSPDRKKGTGSTSRKAIAEQIKRLKKELNLKTKKPISGKRKIVYRGNKE